MYCDEPSNVLGGDSQPRHLEGLHVRPEVRVFPPSFLLIGESCWRHPLKFTVLFPPGAGGPVKESPAGRAFLEPRTSALPLVEGPYVPGRAVMFRPELFIAHCRF